MSDSMDVAQADARPLANSIWSEQDTFLRALLESGLLLLLIRFCEPLFFGPGYYSELDFHPFWIVVLLASLQYGVFGGVAAAGLASLLMEWPPRPIGVDITEHYIDMAIQPLHWLLAALLLGSYRYMQIREVRRLQHELEDTSRMNEELAEEVERMDTSLAHAELSLMTVSDKGPETMAFQNALLELLFASSADVELAAAFEKAAVLATDIPTGLVLVDDEGRFAEETESDSLASLPLPLKNMSELIERIRTEQRSAIISRRELLQDEDGFLVVMGVHVGRSPDLAGAVIMLAEDQDAALLAQPAAELLGLAVSTALHAGLEEAKDFPSNSITIFPTGTQ